MTIKNIEDNGQWFSIYIDDYNVICVSKHTNEVMIIDPNSTINNPYYDFKERLSGMELSVRLEYVKNLMKSVNIANKFNL